MKKIIRNSILAIAAFVILASNVFASGTVMTKEEEYVRGYHQKLEELKNKMFELPKAGDVAIDFLQESICYSETIKIISNNFINYTDNDAVKNLAEEIVQKQDDDINSMRKLLEEANNNVIESKDKENSYIEMYEKILNDALQKISEENSGVLTLDQIYLRTMLICYEGDLKMETTALRYISNESLKEETKKEIEIENKQVEKMKKLLSEL